MALLAVFGTHLGPATVVLTLLRRYHWYHAAIVLERKVNAPFYEILADTVLDMAKTSNGAPFALEMNFVTIKSSDILEADLNVIKQKHRGT